MDWFAGCDPEQVAQTSGLDQRTRRSRWVLHSLPDADYQDAVGTSWPIHQDHHSLGSPQMARLYLRLYSLAGSVRVPDSDVMVRDQAARDWVWMGVRVRDVGAEDDEDREVALM